MSKEYLDRWVKPLREEYRHPAQWEINLTHYPHAEREEE